MERWPSPSSSPRSSFAPVSLPAGYRLDSSQNASSTHLDAIIDALLCHPKIYWGKDRTKEVLARQIERAWTCVCVVRETEGGEEELAGFCRVISDGEGWVILMV